MRAFGTHINERVDWHTDSGGALLADYIRSR